MRYSLLQMIPAVWWLLLLPSCRKTADEPTLVEGQVVVAGTNQPVAQAQVQVWAQRGAGLSSGYEPVGSSYSSDAQGHFAFAVEPQANRNYVLRAEKQPGYSTEWGAHVPVLLGRRNRAVRLPVQAPAWVRLLLVDEAPTNRVTLYVSGIGGSGYTLRAPRDTSLVFLYAANREAFLYWRLTPERLPEVTGQRTFTLHPLDTLTVRVAF